MASYDGSAGQHEELAAEARRRELEVSSSDPRVREACIRFYRERARSHEEQAREFRRRGR